MVNLTDICLIPKFDEPKFVCQFRHISLCSIAYKILTKILVNRLKPVMPYLISHYQTCFISGRSIQENIVVAQELVHSMRNMNGKIGFFVIKVSLAKAYDRLRWAFVEKVMVEVGLPPSMVSNIMHCITQVQENILWNGPRSPFFATHRGLQQGDTLSLYLFIMSMDRLSHLIIQQEDGGWIPMKVGRNGSRISHLMFTNDLLLFGQAIEDQMNTINKVLKNLCDMFGQNVSQDKTSIFIFSVFDGQS